MSIKDLSVSVRGVQREIDKRTWEMNDLRIRYNGYKKDSSKNNPEIIKHGIRLLREVRRLRVIRTELNFILQLEESKIFLPGRAL